jgi:hypothetical protein
MRSYLYETERRINIAGSARGDQRPPLARAIYTESTKESTKKL